MPGNVIQNIANIYFDFNDPAITEPSVLVAEFGTGLSQQNDNGIHLSPNPTTDLLTVMLPSNADRNFGSWPPTAERSPCRPGRADKACNWTHDR
ncbi:MAG: hypothetical protein R2818_13260 [Flavobacteriales bacterium]